MFTRSNYPSGVTDLTHSPACTHLYVPTVALVGLAGTQAQPPGNALVLIQGATLVGSPTSLSPLVSHCWVRMLLEDSDKILLS